MFGPRDPFGVGRNQESLVSKAVKMSTNKLSWGAGRIINTCLGVRPGEDVVVVADRPNLAVGLALARAGREAGAEVSLMLMEQRKAHAENPPGSIAEAMRRADAAVLATVFSLSNSPARQQACKAGTRIISIPGCREEILTDGAIEADFEQLRPMVEKMGRVLSAGEQMQISSELGTDVRVKLCGNASVDQFSMAHEPGSWAPAPHVEAGVGPCLDGVDGVLMVDGVIVPGGVPEETVRVVLEGGKVTAIEGGQDAERLRALLENFNDPNMYQVVEVGIGLNPQARMGRGRMVEDEGQFGTLHLGLGEGGSFGLPVSAPSHLDLIIRRPRVIVDGKEILAEERLSEAFIQKGNGK